MRKKQCDMFSVVVTAQRYWLNGLVLLLLCCISYDFSTFNSSFQKQVVFKSPCCFFFLSIQKEREEKSSLPSFSPLSQHDSSHQDRFFKVDYNYFSVLLNPCYLKQRKRVKLVHSWSCFSTGKNLDSSQL